MSSCADYAFIVRGMAENCKSGGESLEEREGKNVVYRFQEAEETPFLQGHLKMGGQSPQGDSIDVNSRYFTRNGKPWLGVMGEMHYARCARESWKDRLAKMKAGGVSIVATYLFWIYHEEEEGNFDFSGDLDIRSFVLECQRLHLDVVLRVGPWAHGECRNGGFPDWLLQKPFNLRDNNPGYMEKVRIWFEKIYEQVEGLFYKDGGNIIGIQFENELVDGAEHLLALKELALEIGYEAPLYTVTGWNSKYGAKIPTEDVVPVFGAYPDAPWDPSLEQLPLSRNYLFNRMRNDSAIGLDLIKDRDAEGWRLPYERYPFATCELGGGIQVTHHRRPMIQGLDIYALSLVKLGSGNNLIGYYMYCGGTNKIGKLSTLNESKATGYPNDYTILSYDFQGMISEYGEIREQYRLTNLLHLFVQDFGEMLAPMCAVDSVSEPAPEEMDGLRCSMRTDGGSGFVFVNHYQRLARMEDLENVVIDTGSVVFPALDVKGDVSFFMPFMLDLGQEGAGGPVLEYATAQPVCRVDNTVFFAEIEGILPVYQFVGGEAVQVHAGLDSGFVVGGAGAGVNIVTLTWQQAKYLRRLEGELYLGEGCDLYMQDGSLKAVQEGAHTYYHWQEGVGFEQGCVGKPCVQAMLERESIEQLPFTSPYLEELLIGGLRKVTYSRVFVTGPDGFVEIPGEADVQQLYVRKNAADGREIYELAADNFYYGKPWRLPAKLLYGRECYLAVSEMKDDFYREFS